MIMTSIKVRKIGSQPVGARKNVSQLFESGKTGSQLF